VGVVVVGVVGVGVVSVVVGVVGVGVVAVVVVVGVVVAVGVGVEHALLFPPPLRTFPSPVPLPAELLPRPASLPVRYPVTPHKINMFWNVHFQKNALGCLYSKKSKHKNNKMFWNVFVF
jgi:hypothetical protein